MCRSRCCLLGKLWPRRRIRPFDNRSLRRYRLLRSLLPSPLPFEDRGLRLLCLRRCHRLLLPLSSLLPVHCRWFGRLRLRWYRLLGKLWPRHVRPFHNRSLRLLRLRRCHRLLLALSSPLPVHCRRFGRLCLRRCHLLWLLLLRRLLPRWRNILPFSDWGLRSLWLRP